MRRAGFRPRPPLRVNAGCGAGISNGRKAETLESASDPPPDVCNDPAGGGSPAHGDSRPRRAWVLRPRPGCACVPGGLTGSGAPRRGFRGEGRGGLAGPSTTPPPAAVARGGRPETPPGLPEVTGAAPGAGSADSVLRTPSVKEKTL